MNTPNLTGARQVHRYPTIARRVLTVTRVEDLAPHYRRIHLTGDDLADGFPFAHFAPADHVKLFFPDPATGELNLPTPGARGLSIGHGPAPVSRDYTPRAWDPAARDLVIDFVLHDDGVAAAWAARAVPGSTLGVFGPRGSGYFPEDYPHYLIGGDETALPALARFLEEAPPHARVTAVITVADVVERIALETSPNATVHWVDRSTAVTAPGHGSALETALRAVPLDPSERTFVFVAGEAGALKPIRAYFRRELGMAPQQVEVKGYWKLGVAGLDHHSPEATGAEDD